jgi:iron complex outermembrane receptor protein
MVKQATAFLVVMMVVFGWSGWLYAQQNTDVVMDEVVVTASRIEEKSIDVPAHVTVITSGDIKNSTAQNVAEVLSTMGGVHVSDTGGNKRNYWVDMRGFGESAPQNLLLLVDGRRVNLPDLSGPDWNLIPLERIERIEVIRGSRATVLYGDNATQGAINIITKEGRRLEGDVTAKGGSYNTFKGHSSISGANELLSYDLTAGYFDTDGYRNNSDTEAKDIGGNFRIDPTDWFRMHLSAGYHYDNTRNPGAILQSDFDNGAQRTDTFFPDDFTETDDYYVKAGLGFDFLSNDAFNLETSLRKREAKYYGSSPAYWFEGDTQTDILTVSPQLVFRGDFDGITNRVTLGVDYTDARQDYDNYSEYFGSPNQIVADLKKENVAYFFQDELGVGERLSISGGYRLDIVTFKYSPASPVDKREFDKNAYNIGINYTFNPQTHLYASYTKGFRHPVLDEQFNYSSSTVDTTLKPQLSDNVEAGGSFRVPGGFVLGLNLFFIRTEDEIYLESETIRNQNLDGTTERQGAEMVLTWTWKALTLSGTFTRTIVDIEGGQYHGKQFPFVPESKASGKAMFRPGGGLTLGLEALHVGESVLLGDFENEYDKADAYTVVNAKIRYDWRMLTFFADLNNVLNEEYTSFSVVGYDASSQPEPGSYPAPEFNFLLGVAARFGG